MTEQATENTTEQTTEQRPDWLPEKFSSAEALAAAYAELEAKQGAGAVPPKEEAQPEKPEKPAEAAQEEKPDEGEQASSEAEKVVEKAGLDFDALKTEFAEKGELTQDSLAKLEAAGITKDMVDSFIAGQQAQAEAYSKEIASEVGGVENMNAMIAWAAENMTAEEIAAYNDTIDTGDAAKVKIALAGLKAKHDAAVGVRPNLIGGKTSPAAAQGYDNQRQLSAAMNDPRYQNDPAYRAEVERKLAVTTAF